MKVGLVGVTGYAGTVLYQLLLQHPEIDEIVLYGHSQVNIHLSAVAPYLAGASDPMIHAFSPAEVMQATDCVFFATSAGVTSQVAHEFIAADFPVIDLSGDMRLKDPASYEQWYHKAPAAAADLAAASYGLSDFKPLLTNYVANPGCYATATLLGFAPLVQNQLVDTGSLIVDAKSGLSGAGKKLGTSSHFMNANENVTLYKPNAHQHIPEIIQQLHAWDPKVTTLQFMTTLIPVDRGIMAAIYAHVDKGLAEQGAAVVDKVLTQAFQDTYANDADVHLAGNALPSIKDVAYSNLTALGWVYNASTGVVTVVSVIDNMLKGAAGQAMQNFNRLFGFSEMTAVPLQPALI